MNIIILLFLLIIQKIDSYTFIYQNADFSIDNEYNYLEQQYNVYSMSGINELKIMPQDLADVPMLHAGILAQDFAVIENALIYEPSTINYHAFGGNTPLHLAIMRKNESIMKFLINKGADINSLNDFGDTPLHTAIKYNSSITVLEYLLIKGANPNLINKDNLTIVDLARQYKNIAILSYLSSLNRDIKYKPVIITNVATVTNTRIRTVEVTNLLTNIIQNTNIIDIPNIFTNHLYITNINEVTNVSEMTNFNEVTNINTVEITNENIVPQVDQDILTTNEILENSSIELSNNADLIEEIIQKNPEVSKNN